jgi:hypothetical protein
MISKTKDRELAIKLRRQGLSYSQILAQVPVAKSTLSLWLRSVRLSIPEQHMLTQKKLAAAKRGGESKRRQRLLRTAELIEKAQGDVGTLSKREKWLVGAALYWAEGSKQRSASISNAVTFNNSDPVMLRFFKEWLLQSLEIELSHLKFEIYIHETQKHRVKEAQKYWARRLVIPLRLLQTVYFKKNIIKRTRKNPENGYYGLIRITVRSSSALNRTITGWIEGIVT